MAGFIDIFAHRRLADPRADAAGGVGVARRLGGRRGLPDRHLERPATTASAARSAPIFPTSTPPAPMCSTASRRRRSIPPQQFAREQAIFGAGDAVLRLALSAVLPRPRRRCWRLMPYWLALLVWQGATLRVLSLGDPRRRSALSPNRTSGSCLRSAFPPVFINLGHGHNGFLTAALIGAALGRSSTAGRSSPASCSGCSPTSRNSGC